MRPNVIALLADLFNLFEISPRVLPDNRTEVSNYPSEFHAANASTEQGKYIPVNVTPCRIKNNDILNVLNTKLSEIRGTTFHLYVFLINPPC